MVGNLFAHVASLGVLCSPGNCIACNYTFEGWIVGSLMHQDLNRHNTIFSHRVVLNRPVSGRSQLTAGVAHLLDGIEPL